MRRTLLSALVIALPAMGCSLLTSAADRATDRAADRAVDNAVDNSMPANQPSNANPNADAAAAQQQAAMANYGPMMARAYGQMMFAMAFGAGGYAPEEVAYKPGQYTRWSGKEGTTFERAYLFNDADGNPWWKMKYVTKDGKNIIMEALFSPDRSKLLRERAQFPQDKAPQEIPVEENTYYTPPHHLTKQSLHGADQGVESVTVPAGSFKAHHYVFGDAMSGSAEFWVSDKVPGGEVRQLHKATNGNDHGDYELALTSYGDDAKSELGTKP
jgi:hypothetical protein